MASSCAGRRCWRPTTAVSIAYMCLLLAYAPSRILVSSFQASSTRPLSPELARTHRHDTCFLNIDSHSVQNRWGRTSTNITPNSSGKGSSTSLNMFMGSDGGLFGIGTPELFTILLVGYFVLGPSDLYKLVKEVGKFIQNVRTLGTEASKTFENTMESQLELKEIRKAQRELNDAFSFRRSINVDDQGDAFSTIPTSNTGTVEETMATGMGATAAAATATAPAPAAGTEGEAAAPPKRKKKRRRVKKKQPEPEPAVALKSSTTSDVSSNIPDLDMSDEAFSGSQKIETSPKKKEKDWFADDDDDTEVKLPSAAEMAKEDMEWLESTKSSMSTMTSTTKEESSPTTESKDPAAAAAEQNRFQQQLNDSWNQKVMENEEQLAPLAMIMEKLAILEEEKAAADRRLEDEFRQRFQLEEDFYRKKRELLEETAAKVQQDAYVTLDSSSSTKK